MPLPCAEEEIRLRLILLMRLVCLFRGIDSANAKRSSIKTSSQPWFLETNSKGRGYYSHYPIPDLTPKACCPQEMLQRYILVTAPYVGGELLLTLPNQHGVRLHLSPDSINSLSTKWLKANGYPEYTAHSTRGASATSLLKRGIPPALVQALGDWAKSGLFPKFFITGGLLQLNPSRSS